MHHEFDEITESAGLLVETVGLQQKLLFQAAYTPSSVDRVLTTISSLTSSRNNACHVGGSSRDWR